MTFCGGSGRTMPGRTEFVRWSWRGKIGHQALEAMLADQAEMIKDRDTGNWAPPPPPLFYGNDLNGNTYSSQAISVEM